MNLEDGINMVNQVVPNFKCFLLWSDEHKPGEVKILLRPIRTLLSSL